MATITRLPMPALVSNRSYLLVHDSVKDQETGSLTLVSTDQGAETLLKDFAPFLEKSEIARLHFSVVIVTPIEGGVQTEGAYCLDLAGSLSSSQKKKGAQLAAMVFEKFYNYLKSGCIPSPEPQELEEPQE